MEVSDWGVKEEQLKEFRDWLDKQEHLPDVPDEYLEIFLHSCYFDIKKAKKALEVYMKLKTKSPELFSNRKLEDDGVKKHLESCYLGVLPNITAEGYSVVWGTMRTRDISAYYPEAGLKILFMTVDRVLQERKGCPGIVFVYDLENIGLRHMLKTPFSALLSYFEFLQEAEPMRFKGIHFLNGGSLANYIMRITRPFLSKENLKKIHFHPLNRLEGIFDEIKKEDIPSDYGGSGQSLSKMHDENIKGIKSLRDWFSFNETLKYMNQKKNKKNSGEEPLEINQLSIE